MDPCFGHLHKSCGFGFQVEFAPIDMHEKFLARLTVSSHRKTAATSLSQEPVLFRLSVESCEKTWQRSLTSKAKHQHKAF